MDTLATELGPSTANAPKARPRSSAPLPEPVTLDSEGSLRAD